MVEGPSYVPLPLHERELVDAIDARRPHVQDGEPLDVLYRELVDSLAALDRAVTCGAAPRSASGRLRQLVALALDGAGNLLAAEARTREYEGEAAG